MAFAVTAAVSLNATYALFTFPIRTSARAAFRFLGLLLGRTAGNGAYRNSIRRFVCNYSY